MAESETETAERGEDGAPSSDRHRRRDPFDVSLGARVMLPLFAVALGALGLLVLLVVSGNELRAAWADTRRVDVRLGQLVALERATTRLNREVKGYLDRPAEASRTDVETTKSEFTGNLWRVRDGAEPEDGEDVDAFSEAARRYLIGFDDLRGLEIDIELLYDGDLAEIGETIRARLDALDLAIRPGDTVLRPQVATAYDRFAEFRIQLEAYRRDRDLARINAARQARDAFEAAIEAIGASPSADARTYAIERFHTPIATLDALFERLIAISWRKTLWLAGYVDGNRESMLEALAHLVERQERRAAAVTTRFEARVERATYEIGGIALAALAFGFVVARSVGRSISRRIAEQTALMRGMVAGIDDRPVPDLDAVDEIGEAARALEVFRIERVERRHRRADQDIQERRWLSVLETSPIAIAIFSAIDGRLVFDNARWAELFPQPAAGAPIARANDLADRFVDPALASRLAFDVDRQGGVSSWQAEMRGAGAATWWALMELRPIDFAGGPAHILWVYDDSEGRRAEAEVAAARDRAEAALERLARAQDELVEAEKLAAVGGLVAGVAHEVNNPVGIGLTVASTLERRAEAFVAETASGGLRKSRLDEFVAGVRDAAAQMVANLTRAADLVASFKQVAVDRTHPDRRTYDLAEATEQIVASLRPSLKTTQIGCEVDVPAGLTMEGYPGAWGQIVTNLFVNATSHAFTYGRQGVMRIVARPVGDDRVGVTFADDGVGMDAETARRAFEPFFTTRRGRGGSGLGLHIVRTLVVNRMGGRIRIDTAPGEGTRFEISVPRVAPEDPAGSRAEERDDARWPTTT